MVIDTGCFPDEQRIVLTNTGCVFPGNQFNVQTKLFSGFFECFQSAFIGWWQCLFRIMQNGQIVFESFGRPSRAPDFMTECIQRIGKAGFGRIVQIIERQTINGGNGPDTGLMPGEGNIHNRKREGIKYPPRHGGQFG